MKKFLIILIIIGIGIMLPNNNSKAKSEEIEIINLIPIRETFERLDYDVSWDNITKEVIVKKGYKIIYFSNQESSETEKLYKIGDRTYTKIGVLEKYKITHSIDKNNKLNLQGFSEGDFIKEIEIITYDNEKINFSENTKNKIIIFGASWCPYCIEYIDNLNKLIKPGSEILGEIIYVDLTGESKETLTKLLNHNLVKYVNDSSEEISRIFSPKVFPTTYFINDKGKIEKIYEGLLTEAQIKKELIKK